MKTGIISLIISVFVFLILYTDNFTPIFSDKKIVAIERATSIFRKNIIRVEISEEESKILTELYQDYNKPKPFSDRERLNKNKFRSEIRKIFKNNYKNISK
jgi:hypothetical protein